MLGGGYGDDDWLDREWQRAGNARIGCGFITWSLRQTASGTGARPRSSARRCYAFVWRPTALRPRCTKCWRTAHLPSADPVAGARGNGGRCRRHCRPKHRGWRARHVRAARRLGKRSSPALGTEDGCRLNYVAPSHQHLQLPAARCPHNGASRDVRRSAQPVRLPTHRCFTRSATSRSPTASERRERYHTQPRRHRGLSALDGAGSSPPRSLRSRASLGRRSRPRYQTCHPA